ncbi:MAG TPA: hypothetical protein VKG91_10160 [Roseiarcus sp.]|nr:hypothetical protein [Roseiarcus sp.]
MLASLVRPNARPPGLRQIVADFGPEYVAHGFIGWLFAATAPVAIILAVGSRGGLLDGLVTLAENAGFISKVWAREPRPLATNPSSALNLANAKPRLRRNFAG